MFSDGFSEGQTRDINEEFPSDSHPYTEYYDYLSDSDLEDGSCCSEELEYAEAPENIDPELPSSPWDLDTQAPSTAPLDHPPQSLADAREVQNDGRLAPIFLGSSNISRLVVFQTLQRFTKNGEGCHYSRHGSGDVCVTPQRLIFIPDQFTIASRPCSISYTPARYTSPRSFRTLLRQEPGIGLQRNSLLRQRSQFIGLQTW